MKDNYIGSMKIQETKYGPIYKALFSIEDLKELVQRMNANDQKLVNIDFKKKKKPSEKKFTHYGEVNDYKPKEEDPSFQQDSGASKKEDDLNDDLPF